MIEDKSKCFILTKEGEYEEITYEELKRRREAFESYKYKKFLPLHGMLMEVKEEDYLNFYKEFDRYRYYERLQNYYNVLSVDEILFSGKDIFTDTNENLILKTEKKQELEELHQALLSLTSEELNLIHSLFWEENTIREYAKIIETSFTTIEYRKQITLEKLRKIIKHL